MIRNTGILAAAASAGLVLLLAVRMRTAEFEGRVSASPNPENDTPLYRPAPGTLWLLTIGEEPTRESFERLTAAGISTIGRTGWMAGPNGALPCESYWRLCDLPAALTKEARPGDELRVRGKTLYLRTGDGLRWKSHLRYELRRGTDFRVADGPGNGMFVLVCVLIPSAPLVLWLLGSGTLVGLKLVRRRG